MPWSPPDYLGYAKSTYAFHPYLHADSQATTVIDSVRAARNAADAVGAKLSGKVMFTGYSQGGHASMAAHRAAERDHAGEFERGGGRAFGGALQPVGLVPGHGGDRRVPVLCAHDRDLVAKGLRQHLR